MESLPQLKQALSRVTNDIRDLKRSNIQRENPAEYKNESRRISDAISAYSDRSYRAYNDSVSKYIQILKTLQQYGDKPNVFTVKNLAKDLVNWAEQAEEGLKVYLGFEDLYAALRR